MSDDITHDLDLLDDWLAGKGYGEEAGLVLRTLSLIHKQAREIEKLRAELIEEKQCSERENRRKRMYYLEVRDAEKVIAELRAKVATLRAALKRISEQDAVEMALDPQWAKRTAAAAPKETGDG